MKCIIAWRDGVTFIPENDFKDYAEELAYDIGVVNRDSQITVYIDWESWADDVKMDYSVVEFDGDTYWWRE